MKQDLSIIITFVLIFTLGLGIGTITGKLWGENRGLRAQDSNMIRALGKRNAILERDLRAANRILTQTAQIDSSIRKFIEERIKAYQESNEKE